MPIQNEKLRQSFLSALSERIVMPFDDFVEWALYDEDIGYYRQSKLRVGKSKNADFYTSTSIKSFVWGKLLIEACCKLLGKNDPRDFVFVEIAAEPGSNSLDQNLHPFKAIKTIRLGEVIQIPDNAIVFSNEWLDAQPFKRFRFDPASQQWSEIGVKLEERVFTEETLSDSKKNIEITKQFPKNYNTPYTIDWPTGAESALKNLLKANWRGLFLTFDYGLNFDRICSDFPEGTARTYANHRCRNEIVANPGQEDITCHLCWDALRKILSDNQFTNVNLKNQESFFMNNGSEAIRSVIENQKANDEYLGSIKELIHPQHLGQKFQVLYGQRGI